MGSKDEYKISDLLDHCQIFMEDIDNAYNKIKINYADDIEETISNFSKFWKNISSKSFRLSNTRIRRELEIVIKKLFLGASDNEPISSTIDVETLIGSGKSSAYLFKLAPRVNLNSSLRKYAVLKFGPKFEVKLESHNYDKYVEWFLTVQQTVKKIAYEETANFAGLLYGFPMDSDRGFVSFADFVRTKNVEMSCNIIEELFSTENKHWLAIDGTMYKHKVPTDTQTYYIDYGIRATEESITNEFEKLTASLNELSIKRGAKVLKVDDTKKTITIAPISLTIPNPVKYMMLPYTKRIDLSLVHGDLHANNILIGTDAKTNENKCFLIDFYYTGFGHIFRDFIDLELSIRYDILCSRHISGDTDRLTRNDSKDISNSGLNLLKQLEKDIIKYHVNGLELDKESQTYKDSRLLKVYKLVTTIRNMAFMNFPDRKEQYYTGLAYSSIKAIKYFFPLDVKLYRLMISGLYFDLVGKPGAGNIQ
ncbi:MAG: hypothetical protein A2077_00610 [Nitrospirae bacterium GWC2_46_6]|nr:MAG: hypothetical protein A2077_00610 [Nitrospirae bacterium GWC2_46_6]OGW21823.1 MAG: hypothetical protein A2Z82_09415 [Nitrospirae bacterium GWA2_46_11]OGW24103.1 MAG: hypothetical protein A2X55_10360 [Nitrospirae bacterium GWB2_47_37]HAK88728.1 hypothetical protein [Nitrospiraceae bacterium]HCZ11415.1 hypothetical protein [Nitrospiraceae bacterium]